MNFRDIKCFADVIVKSQYLAANKKYNDEIIDECAKLFYKKMPPHSRDLLIAEQKQTLKYYDETEATVLKNLLEQFYEKKYTMDILREYIRDGNNIIKRSFGLYGYNIPFRAIMIKVVNKYC